MKRIFFEDDGQDFLEWDINEEGEVVACRPFQGWVWIGVKVHNKDIKPGDHLDITLPDGRWMPVELWFRIKELPG